MGIEPIEFVAKKYKKQMVIEPLETQDIENMRLCLRLKMAQHTELQELLLETEDAEIVEDCTKRKRGSGLFWGAALEGDVWQEKNWLGFLWMELRLELGVNQMAALPECSEFVNPRYRTAGINLCQTARPVAMRIRHPVFCGNPVMIANLRTLRRILRFAGLLIVISAGGFAALPPAAAGERQFLPPNDLVSVEIHRPLDLWQHPLVRSVVAELKNSSRYRALKHTPQYDRLKLVRELIERGTGETWQNGLRKLTAGGVTLSFSPGKNLGLTVVVTASDAKTISRFVVTSREFVRSRLSEYQRSQVLAVQRKNGVEFVRVGTAAYAVVGRRFVFGSTEARMWNAIKAIRSAKPKSNSSNSAPGKRPLVTVTVNMAAVRKLPQVKKSLQLPTTNTGLTALLGGWVDLLRRSGKITGELAAVGNRLEIRVRSDARQRGVVRGLQGFFADGKTRTIAPPLQLPKMIYSASWYRDYQALWNARSQLLAAKSLKRLEQGNQTIRQQFAVIGGNVLPSHAFSQLGPHFRVVAVRQLQTEYKVASPNRIPAAGLVIDVRDEKKFRKEVMPLFRAITLILTVAEAKMVPRKTTYKGAELTSVRFRSDPQSLKTANQLRLSFAPTYTVTRGHLIVGSTRTIVEQLIDAIDKQSRERNSSSTTATEIQQFSFSEAAAAMRDVQSITSLQQVFGSGLTVREAKAELQVYRRILQVISRVTTRAGFDKNGFEYRIRIGEK